MECTPLVKVKLAIFTTIFVPVYFKIIASSRTIPFAASLVADHSDWAVGVISRNLILKNTSNLYVIEM